MSGHHNVAAPTPGLERQITSAPHGHILTNINVWSADSKWIVYDVRSDAAGSNFDGDAIERVHVETGGVERLYTSRNGAHCGVATWHPTDPKIVFILGPENPTPDWTYGMSRRQGAIVDVGNPGVAIPLDARDLTPPFTPGALRGGTHVHVFSPDGRWVSFTYNDQVLSGFKEENAEHETDARQVGISVPVEPVTVPKTHQRNHDGNAFSVLVTRTTGNPRPGSDEIRRAFEDGWVGTNGYLRADGSRQRRAIAFQGEVLTATGQPISEVFIVDLPEDPTQPGDGPLQGTATTRPRPPKGVTQRRLTRTADRKFPGIQGPRHWLRTSPDGSRIAFLMKDDAGVVQLWTVSPNGGEPVQVTHNPHDIASAFTWSPDGRLVAHAMDNSVCLTEAATGRTTRLTPRSADAEAPRPEACVFSPDGKKIAYMRNIIGERCWNQVFAATVADMP